jgi:hypothetical protein
MECGKRRGRYASQSRSLIKVGGAGDFEPLLHLSGQPRHQPEIEIQWYNEAAIAGASR